MLKREYEIENINLLYNPYFLLDLNVIDKIAHKGMNAIS